MLKSHREHIYIIQIQIFVWFILFFLSSKGQRKGPHHHRHESMSKSFNPHNPDHVCRGFPFAFSNCALNDCCCGVRVRPLRVILMGCLEVEVKSFLSVLLYICIYSFDRHIYPKLLKVYILPTSGTERHVCAQQKCFTCLVCISCLLILKSQYIYLRSKMT